MHQQTHAVIRLAVHFPGEQSITFNSQEISKAIAKAEQQDSTLNTWFKLNQQDPEAAQYKYYDIPRKYVFNSKVNWVKQQRKHEKIIGRMHYVNMRDINRYFLRLNLLHVSEAKSFEDLLTVN